jgi:hypothetical protein
MTTFFCFSADAGNYKGSRSDDWNKKCPFYVRSGVIIDSKKYNLLKKFIKDHKEKFGIPLDVEIKYSDCWLVKNNNRDKRLQRIPHLGYNELLKYIHDVITFVRIQTDSRLIYTVTCNHSSICCERSRLIEMHVQDLMQRVEMQINHDRSNKAIFFIANETNNNDSELRDVFLNIFNSDKYLKYNSLIESVSISRSHHNIGIQIADYFAGLFNNALKGFYPSVDFFKEIFPMIRCAPRGDVMGYGIMEVPSDGTVRKNISERITELIN